MTREIYRGRNNAERIAKDQEFIDSESLLKETHTDGNRQIENGSGEIDQSLSAPRTTLIFTSVDYGHNVLVPLSPLAFSTTRPEQEDQYRSILADTVNPDIADLFIEDQRKGNHNGPEPTTIRAPLFTPPHRNMTPVSDSFDPESRP